MPREGDTDVFSRAKRSEVMSRIRSKDTKPERLLRRALFATGLRYRLHSKGLAGRPDLVFPRHRVVLFVNGCFWHGHECHLFRWPRSNEDFWRAKIRGNVARDKRARRRLNALGWRVLTVWECQIRGRQSRLPALASRLAARIRPVAP